MKIPSLLYGTQSDVRKASERIVTQLCRGARYLDLMQPMIDTREHDGNIIIQGSRGSSTGTARHFHCYWLAHAMSRGRAAKRVKKSVEKEFITGNVGPSWGLPVLFTAEASVPIIEFQQERPFLEAVRSHWTELIAEGPRYAYSTSPPTELWSVPTSITVILGRFGVTSPMIHRDYGRSGIQPFSAHLLPA